VGLCGEKRFDGLIHDGDERKNVTHRDIGRRLNAVGLIFLRGRMPTLNFLVRSRNFPETLVTGLGHRVCKWKRFDVEMVCQKKCAKCAKCAKSLLLMCGSPPGFGLVWLFLSWPMVSFFVATTGLKLWPGGS
jgi:hypothetical protein